MSEVLEYLKKDDVAVVFDIDGVLAAFEFGKLHHNGCFDDDWEEFVKNEKPYDKVRAIPQIQKFVRDKGIKNVYACSVSEDYEKENKSAFVVREYGIPQENIVFVKEKTKKIDFLKELAEKMGGEDKVALVEDTVKTLNQIYDNTDMITVHVTSFFFYK